MEYPITMSHKEYRRISRANRDRDARIAVLERAVVEAAVEWRAAAYGSSRLSEHDHYVRVTQRENALHAAVDALIAAREGHGRDR
jgi:hypothetical protein